MNEELLIKLELNLVSNDAILFYQFNWQDDFHFLPKENQEQIEKKINIGKIYAMHCQENLEGRYGCRRMKQQFVKGVKSHIAGKLHIVSLCS